MPLDERAVQGVHDQILADGFVTVAQFPSGCEVDTIPLTLSSEILTGSNLARAVRARDRQTLSELFQTPPTG